VVVFFEKLGNEPFAHRKDAKVAERMPFCSGGEMAPEQKPPPRRGKGFAQASAGGREAVFYPAASHGRVKENFNPLRSLRLCGEYVTAFTKWRTWGPEKEFYHGENF
jgi:hypothetical protein